MREGRRCPRGALLRQRSAGPPAGQLHYRQQPCVAAVPQGRGLAALSLGLPSIIGADTPAHCEAAPSGAGPLHCRQQPCVEDVPPGLHDSFAHVGWSSQTVQRSLRVLAPRARWRAAIVPCPAPDDATADAGSPSARRLNGPLAPRGVRHRGAGVDRCGGARRIQAAVTEARTRCGDSLRRWCWPLSHRLRGPSRPPDRHSIHAHRPVLRGFLLPPGNELELVPHAH